VIEPAEIPTDSWRAMGISALTGMTRVRIDKGRVQKPQIRLPEASANEHQIAVWKSAASTFSNIRYNNDANPDHVLDLYLPPDGQLPYPTILMFHGDGDTKGDHNGMAGYFDEAGFAAARTLRPPVDRIVVLLPRLQTSAQDGDVCDAGLPQDTTGNIAAATGPADHHDVLVCRNLSQASLQFLQRDQNAPPDVGQVPLTLAAYIEEECALLMLGICLGWCNPLRGGGCGRGRRRGRRSGHCWSSRCGAASGQNRDEDE
jgi:hypothetical protein